MRAMISASLRLSSCCVLANPIPRDSLPALEGPRLARADDISHAWTALGQLTVRLELRRSERVVLGPVRNRLCSAPPIVTNTVVLLPGRRSSTRSHPHGGTAWHREYPPPTLPRSACAPPRIVR